jgi:heterotetrameric sarcosine oxidase gamma subunit
VRAAFGIDLPGPGHIAAGAAVTAVWIKPETWLLLAPRGEEGALARSVATAVGNAGSVVDQSHGKTRFRLAGAHARAVLAKGCRVDPPVGFGPGRSAATQMAQVRTVLRSATMDCFELVVGASCVPFPGGWPTPRPSRRHPLDLPGRPGRAADRSASSAIAASPSTGPAASSPPSRPSSSASRSAGTSTA